MKTLLNMSLKSTSMTACLTLMLLAGSINSASAAWSNGQSAAFALGTASVNSAGSGTATTSSFGASDICVDPVSGKVFVVDLNNNRILRFSSAQGIITNGTAEAVFGQPDFTSSTPNNGGLSASSLNAPWSCAMDSFGHLFVSDYNNYRILRYDNASTKATFGAADGVLGQANFTSSGTGTTASSFGGAYLYAALGPNGSLYIGDTGNKRVLRFDNAAAKSNGAAADGVLGAPNFTTVGAGGYSASTFWFTQGVAVDASGNLYVDDTDRVLRFDNAAGKSNGAAADGVLGVPNFTSAGGGAASQSNFSFAREVEAVGSTLYVSDWGFGRVLVFNNAASKPNGANADNVLGQPNFTSSGGGSTSSQFSAPLGIGVNTVQGYLMVADYHNQRAPGFFNADLQAQQAAPTAIPTLSEWNLALLSFMILTAAVAGRRHRNSK